MSLLLWLAVFSAICLPGAVVLAWARQAGVPVSEVMMGPSALDEAEAVFVTNSLAGARAAQFLDGRPLAEWTLWAKLSSALD